MATISKDNPVFTAIVTLTCDASDQESLVETAEKVAPVFAKQHGFISSSVHRSHDGTQVVTYLQWKTREDHEACRRSPRLMAAGARLMGLLASGRVKMDVKTFDVIAAVEADAS